MLQSEEWVKDGNAFDCNPNTNISQVTAASHPTPNSLSNGTTKIARYTKDQLGSSTGLTQFNFRVFF